ncbi:MAG: glycosyltransferase family 4 protein [Dehalococcoidales bacterium]|jgi:glycosyltransferase involved in cell wall biosynthesis
MNKKRVVLVKTTSLERDINRLIKEIPPLKRSGYQVTLLCWDRAGKSRPVSPPPPETRPDREIRFKFGAPYGIRVLCFLPIWWWVAFWRLIFMKWDAVHAIDFDSAVPATLAAKLKGKPLIYEVLETYEDEIILPKFIRNLAIKIDRLFVHFATRIIVADEMQIEELGGIPDAKVIVIYDSPPDVFHESAPPPPNNDFMLFYDGAIFKARRLNVDKILTAVSRIDGVKLNITGYGDQVSEIKALAAKQPEKIQFLGWVSYGEVLQRTLAADLLFLLPDPVIPMNQYIGGSKLLKAMMCGRPVLANRGTLAARRVQEINCGLVVDAGNVEEIVQAINQLKDDPALCRELGANGRKAWKKWYSWAMMEERLLKVYKEISVDAAVNGVTR